MAEKGLDSTIKCNVIDSIGVPFLANFVGLFVNVGKKVVYLPPIRRHFLQ
jgi:hypothetical protein